MARKRVTVKRKSDTGRNLQFHDNYTGADMSRARFVQEIERGNYTRYHVRVINGVKTPVSNPDDWHDTDKASRTVKSRRRTSTVERDAVRRAVKSVK